MMWGDIQVWVKYPSVFLLGLVVTLCLTPLWRRIAPLWGFVDTPDARRIHLGPIPSAGGLALFAGFHAACALIYFFPWLPFTGHLSRSWWVSYLAVSSCVVVVGVIDDRFRLKPLAKLAGQILVAVVAYLFGMRMGNAFGTPLPLAVDVVSTVVWFLILMNAFNLIDGMDGLAAGLGVVAAAGLGVSLGFRHQPNDLLVCLALAGACIGFLRHNFHPATVFMGDTGSMFIGCSIAAISLGTSSKGTAVATIGVTLLAVGVPILDTGLAVWRRSVRSLLEQGNKDGIAVGDKDHLHHRLLRLGWTQRQVATILYTIGVVLGVVGIVTSVHQEYAIAAIFITFLVGTYVVVRHLAWIELWDCGMAILQGARRQGLGRWAVFIYPIIDIVVMSVALALALWMARHGGTHPLKHEWFGAAPWAVGLPFVLLGVSRAYGRVWSMARVSEFALTGLAAMTGILLWMAGALLTGHYVAGHLGVVACLYLGMAVPAIVGARAFVRLVQDVMAWRARLSTDADGSRRVLLVGADASCLLFLKSSSLACGTGRRVVIAGILDEDPALWGRWVHGYRVMGGIDALERVLDTLGVVEIIITGTVDPQLLTRVVTTARQRNTAVRQWSSTFVTLVP